MITLDNLLADYGNPLALDFERQWIVPFSLPYALIYKSAMVWHSKCHRLAVDKFTAVLTAIKEANLCDAASEYDGIYANRSIRGFAGHPSAHAWGLAIDINPTAFPLGSTKRQDPRLTAIFRGHEFTCGEDFLSRKDPMHFSLTGF